jgi:O-antigen/teichoic acid export membrane protein
LKQNKYSKELAIGYLAQALNVGAGLLLLPAILSYLSPEDVGLWFVFTTLAGLAQLLEFGFNTTIARNLTYAYSGADRIKNSGMPESFATSHHPNLKLVAQLIATSSVIYRYVALTAGLLLFVGGSLYILTLLTPTQHIKTTLLAWILYATGQIVNFYFGYINALLHGRGSVSDSNKAIIFSRIIMILLAVATLNFGMGLLGVGIAMLISSLFGRWLAVGYINSDVNTKSALELAKVISGRLLIRELWHNSSRLGIVQISAFIIQRASILIASSFLGLAAAASFSLTTTVFLVVSNISMVAVQVRLPDLIRAQAEASIESLQKMFGDLVLLGWATFLISFLALILFGDAILSAIGANTLLLPQDQLIIFGFIMALEVNHSIAATYLTTRNTIPFLKSSIYSAAGALVLSLLFVNNFEIIGLIAAQGLVQLVYNNWKWPYQVKRQLGFTWGKLISSAIIRNFH